MTIIKNFYLFNLLAFIFIVSCVPPEPLQPSHVVLTSTAIQSYHLTEKDLKNVQFFLDKKLVIIGETTSIDKNVTRFHKLKYFDKHVYDQVTFPRDLPGKLVRTRLDGNLLQKFLKREVLKLDITFDQDQDSKPDTTRFLTFLPNASGGYELETLYSGRLVSYGNKQYRCVSGCSANAIMVDSEFLKLMDRKNRFAPGNRLH